MKTQVNQKRTIMIMCLGLLLINYAQSTTESHWEENKDANMERLKGDGFKNLWKANLLEELADTSTLWGASEAIYAWDRMSEAKAKELDGTWADAWGGPGAFPVVWAEHAKGWLAHAKADGWTGKLLELLTKIATITYDYNPEENLHYLEPALIAKITEWTDILFLELAKWETKQNALNLAGKPYNTIDDMYFIAHHRNILTAIQAILADCTKWTNEAWNALLAKLHEAAIEERWAKAITDNINNALNYDKGWTCAKARKWKILMHQNTHRYEGNAYGKEYHNLTNAKLAKLHELDNAADATWNEDTAAWNNGTRLLQSGKPQLQDD